MFAKVLVGVDYQQSGRDAIALASKLVAADGELMLAHVRHQPEWAPAQSQKQVRELLERARSAAKVQASLHDHPSASVGRGLHELSELLGADLLVVGSSTRGIVERVLLGDDARAALNGAPCAIAVAPAGYAGRAGALRRVGVGYNESPESEDALATACSIAAEQGASVAVLEVVSLPSTMLMGGPAPLGKVIDDLLSDANDRLEGLDGVETHVVYGSPGEELGAFSGSVDLLVLGSRGYGPIGRLVHGSTSQHLLRVSRCPLLVLTRRAP
ncbi:MAG TPA: universal stress protein [Solirubrobacteraceae bacterium]|nr:universal stress protein [Solirubrobacteraceae bacterium]